MIEQPQSGKYHIYSVTYLQNGFVNTTGVIIYVQEEGHPVNEQAWYKGNKPSFLIDPSPTPFRDEVQAEIDSQVTAGTIDYGNIESCDETDLVAIVRVYIYVDPDIQEKRYFAWKVDTTLNFKPIA
jgi:hypothetical protein